VAGQGMQVRERMARLSMSTTSREPEGDTAMLRGELKAAEDPKPSEKPPPKRPAIVVTRPKGLIRLIRLLPLSATKRLLFARLESVAMVG